MRAEIEARNPHATIVFRDTICEPTKERQRALHAFVDVVECVVVVGGSNSNNTRQLVTTCESLGLDVVHVQSADELPIDTLAAFGSVGLTAGTSTPDAIVDQVEAALLSIGSAS